MASTLIENTQQPGSPGYAANRVSSPGALTPIRTQDSWLSMAAIVALGGVSGIVYYIGLVRPYLLQDYYRTPLLDLAKIDGRTGQAANDWGFTWIVLFACYYLAFRLCPPSSNISAAFRRVGLFLICGWAAFFCINLIFMYPVGAADLFDQIFRARLLAHYGLNPFTTLPSSILGDPFQQYVAWKGDPSPYGPAWESLAAGVSWLAGDSLWNNLILFKLLVSVAYGIGVALTYGILRAVNPDWALRGTLLFAWNPLVLFEVAGNGHNDAIVVMLVLTALYLFVLARRWLVLPALMAAVLTKFVPVLLIPAAAAALWRDRLWVGKRRVTSPPGSAIISNLDALTTLAAGSLIALGLVLVFYLPYWQGASSIGALGRTTLFTASIPKVLVDTLVNDYSVAASDAQFIVRSGALAMVGLVALALAARILLRPRATTAAQRTELLRHTFGAFYEVIFVYLAFATLWFQPWYLMWLVALTAPVGLFTNANRTILFCIGGIGNYFVWDYIWLWSRTSISTIQITSAIVIYTLPLLYTLFVLIDAIRSKAIFKAQL